MDLIVQPCIPIQSETRQWLIRQQAIIVADMKTVLLLILSKSFYYNSLTTHLAIKAHFISFSNVHI